MEMEVGTEVPAPSVPTFILGCGVAGYIEQISAVLHAFD